MPNASSAGLVSWSVNGSILMRSLVSSLLLMALGAGCAFDRNALATNHRYHIFFPPIKLATDDGERIEFIEITMSCGRFRAIGALPDDWSLRVVSPISEKTTLRASAGHGSSTLWSLRELDGSIIVSVEEASCFDIAAMVGTTATVHRFSHSDLILKP
jgi:hypothetical protein